MKNGFGGARRPDALCTKTLELTKKFELLDRKMARRGGFEPPGPCGQWISNPSPCRAGPPPLLASKARVVINSFCNRGSQN